MPKLLLDSASHGPLLWVQRSRPTMHTALSLLNRAPGRPLTQPEVDQRSAAHFTQNAPISFHSASPRTVGFVPGLLPAGGGAAVPAQHHGAAPPCGAPAQRIWRKRPRRCEAAICLDQVQTSTMSTLLQSSLRHGNLVTHACQIGK